MQQTISITVGGKVQGVFFRRYTREKALELGITGWVKNLPDGSVSIQATGTPEQVQALAAWCRTGPSKAKVTSVTIKEQAYQPFNSFTIER